MMLAVAALVACLLCGVTHWCSEILSHGALGALPRYMLGTASIGLPYAGWCFVQPAAIPAGQAVVAWLAVALGAGLGTGLAYLVDHVATQQRVIRILETQVDEPKSRRLVARGE